jgi:hypothetical protein
MRRAREWFAQQSWPVGFHYVPATAISYTDMGIPHSSDPKLIDEELKNPWYGRQPGVVPGYYASGWTPSPGHDLVRDPEGQPVKRLGSE